MIIPEDHIGKRFGRLIVVAEAPRRVTTGGGKRRYQRRLRCQCDCGKVCTVRAHMLVSGRTKSCGCLLRELTFKHGGKGTPEYNSWKSMKQRCLNPKCRHFKRYGGRGIKIYPGWINDFGAFLAYLGKRPTKAHTLDRINVDGNYEPGNVRWATPKDQRANQRPRCPHCGQAMPGSGA